MLQLYCVISLFLCCSIVTILRLDDCNLYQAIQTGQTFQILKFTNL